jgi:hypothetical protein
MKRLLLDLLLLMLNECISESSSLQSASRNVKGREAGNLSELKKEATSKEGR